MKRELVTGIALTATVLTAGCAYNKGRGEGVEACGDIGTAEKVTFEKVELLKGAAVEFIIDNENTWNSGDDSIDQAGEIACFNSSGDLVLTPGGVALQAVFDSAQQ